MHIRSKFVFLPPQMIWGKISKVRFLGVFWCSHYFGQKMRLNLSEDVFFCFFLFLPYSGQKMRLHFSKDILFFFWSWGPNRLFNCPLKISLAPAKIPFWLISKIIASHLCTTVGHQQFREESRKL